MLLVSLSINILLNAHCTLRTNTQNTHISRNYYLLMMIKFYEIVIGKVLQPIAHRNILNASTVERAVFLSSNSDQMRLEWKVLIKCRYQTGAAKLVLLFIYF